MQVLIAISGFCGFCSRIGNTPCTTPFDFLFVISIHIPAWGTTKFMCKVAGSPKFQSTFPRGERPGVLPGLRRYSHFNPRSRVGNDCRRKCCIDLLNISIHVPAWGTTLRLSTHLLSKIFQSTFPRGERRITVHTRLRHHNFNPRSRVGNDSGRLLRTRRLNHFNPRSRVGNDLAFWSSFLM